MILLLPCCALLCLLFTLPYPESLPEWATACAILSGSYLFFVQSQRWKRYDAVHRKYAGRPFESITVVEAQQILNESGMWDMPALSYYSLAFALFKTYGIPSISMTLAGTQEFTTHKRISKRYSDTEIMIATWMNCPIAGKYDFESTGDEEELDPRAMISLARVNWLHSRYKISNDDYLYTLSLFIFEPNRWIQKYGWRPLSPLEYHAFFVYWCEIGRRMGIFEIPASLDELEKWSEVYEEANMKPAETNHEVAVFTTEELVHSIPSFLGIKALAKRIVICLLEERVRIAMKYPPQPALLKKIVVASAPIYFRYVQGYLCLPRWKPGSIVDVTPPSKWKNDKSGCPRMHPNIFRATPWYKPEATGFGKVIDRLMVAFGYYDEMPSASFQSEGYRLEELGPHKVKNMGHEKTMRNAAKLAGFDIKGIWSLNTSSD